MHMYGSFWSLALLFLAPCLMATVGRAEALEIVVDGRPAATIVIDQSYFQPSYSDVELYDDDRNRIELDGPLPERMTRGLRDRNYDLLPYTEQQKVYLAARDLQHYLEKMSGARVPIVGDERRVEGTVVCVGASRYTADLAVDIPAGLTPDRREEAYLIEIGKRAAVLAGNDAGPYWGTYYAVAEFLHRLGVRWYMPSEFGEIVPARPTIAVEPLSFRDTPDFAWRSWWSHIRPDMEHEAFLWRLRNKMHPTDYYFTAFSGDGSLTQFLPGKEEMDSHPEYFAKAADGSLDPFMPNLSSPEAARVVADNMIEYLRQEERRTGRVPEALGFAPEDGSPMDHRPETMALNMGLPGMVGRQGVESEVSISNEWFTFVNRVADRVTEAYPDIIVATNGYANRDVPPLGLDLHPNLAIQYAAIWCDLLKPYNHPANWLGQVYGSHLSKWTRLNRRVHLYRYTETMLLTCFTPVPTTRKLAVEMPFFKRLGIWGFWDEARQAYMERGITTKYIRARTMWDADLDVDATLAEFFQRWYGPAAESAQAYWDALEECMQHTRMLGHEDRILPFVYTPDLVDELETHQSRSEAAAADTPYAEHVQVDRLILEHLKAYMAMYEAYYSGNYQEAIEQADIMFAQRRRLTAISPFFHVPESEYPYSGVIGWGLTERREFFQTLENMVDGTSGELVVRAPRQMRLSLDPDDLGRHFDWYAPEYDRAGWKPVDTGKPFYIQYDETLSAEGIPYTGALWYAFEVDIPRSASDKEVHLYAPLVVPEAWTWVNGEFAGHRPYQEAYNRPLPLDHDVTGLLRPGERNLVVVRLHTGTNAHWVPEGILGRVFLYTPTGAAQ